MISSQWSVIREEQSQKGAINSYRDLKVWAKAMDLADVVFCVTATFPKHQMYVLANQLQRSAISIPSNIAEGSGRNGTKELLQHLRIAYGSLCEVETQSLIARKAGFMREDDFKKINDLAVEIGRMINGLQQSLLKKLTDH